MKIVNRDLHTNPDVAIERLSTLLTKIEKHSYSLLKYLCHFLREVAKHEAINKMSQMNLATVFLHSVVQPEDNDPALLMGTANSRTKLVFLLISQWDKIFKLEYNPHGVGVQVDNLLDLGALTDDTFVADTNFGKGADAERVGENLLDLDVGPMPGGGMLAPIALIPSMPDVDTQHIVDDDNTDNGVEDDDYEPVYDIPRKWSVTNAERQSMISSGSYHSAQEDTDGTSMTSPTQKLPPVPPPRFREVNPPLSRSQTMDAVKPQPDELVLQKSKFYASMDSSLDTTPGSEISSYISNPILIAGVASTRVACDPIVPIRPAPAPPVKQAFSTDSIDTTDSGNSTNDLDEEDEAIESLINTNVSDLSTEDLHIHVATVCSELISQRSKAKELNLKVINIKTKNKQKMLDMAKKLDQEKTATTDAVERVMLLQAKLQEYQLKYGFI